MVLVPFEVMTPSLKGAPGSPLKARGEEPEARGEQVGTRARGHTGPSVGRKPITQGVDGHARPHAYPRDRVRPAGAPGRWQLISKAVIQPLNLRVVLVGGNKTDLVRCYKALITSVSS